MLKSVLITFRQWISVTLISALLLTGKRTRGTVRVTATSTARRTDSKRVSNVYTLVYVWRSSSSTSPTKRKQKGVKSLKQYLAHLKRPLYCSQTRDKINLSPAAAIRYKLWARHEKGIFPLWLILVHHSETLRVMHSEVMLCTQASSTWLWENL